MNSRILWVLIPLMTLCLRATGQTLVSQFGPANYEGWTYENNGGIELNANNINQAKIVLQTTLQGNVTALLSPTLACQNYDSLRVELTYRAFDTTYDASRLSVVTQLTDLMGNQLAMTTTKPSAGLMIQTLRTTVAVPESTTDALLRFSAPRADKDNCAAVTRVLIYGLAGIQGDVNNDGVVDIDDINIVINIILHKDQAENYGPRADVDGHAGVDIEDINAIVNILLHKG